MARKQELCEAGSLADGGIFAWNLVFLLGIIYDLGGIRNPALYKRDKTRRRSYMTKQKEIINTIFSEEEKTRFDNIKKRANDLGVWGISFADASASDAEWYESVLGIIEEDKHIIDAEAGELNDSGR
jgi:hypothetical protein